MRVIPGSHRLGLLTHAKAGQRGNLLSVNQAVPAELVDEVRAVSAWIAIDDADEENGCMRVIPGSHRLGLLTHAKAGQPGNLLSVNQAVPAELVDEARAVSVPLRAGQMSLHHGLLLHSSLPNRSNRRRCGLTLRYVPPAVKQVALNSLGEAWPAVLVRGEDRYRHFPLREVAWAS